MLFRELALADLELPLDIGLAHFAVQTPFAKSLRSRMHAADRLPHEVNGAQSRHQNQRTQVNAAQENHRPDVAHCAEQELLAEEVSNRAAGTLNIECSSPPLQVLRLQLEQARSRSNKQHDPEHSGAHPQTPVKELGRAETEQNGSEQIRRGADEQIKYAG